MNSFLSKDDIVDDIVANKKIDNDFVNILIETDESDLIQFHMSFGRWIRNTYLLWDPSYPFLDGMHPDDYSFEIIKQIQARLQNEPGQV